MEGQTGFQPETSKGFSQGGFQDTSDDAFKPKPSGAFSTGFTSDNQTGQTGFQPDNHGFKNYNESGQTGFQPDNHGFKNYNESGQTGFQPVSTGFQDPSEDPFKPKPSGAFSTGFEHPEDITIKSAELKELSAATKEAQQALQKVYTILGKLGFHPDA